MDELDSAALPCNLPINSARFWEEAKLPRRLTCARVMKKKKRTTTTKEDGRGGSIFGLNFQGRMGGKKQTPLPPPTHGNAAIASLIEIMTRCRRE